MPYRSRITADDELADTVIVQETEANLCFGVSLVGCFTQPIQRPGVLLLYADASEIHDAKEVLRFDIALGSKRTKKLQRCRVVVGFIGGHRILERPSNGTPCNSQHHEWCHNRGAKQPCISH